LITVIKIALANYCHECCCLYSNMVFVVIAEVV